MNSDLMEAPYFVSLHGGHSSQFCEHAEDTLENLLLSAIEKGMAVYGLTEHAPRVESRHIYAEERMKGYTVERLRREFEDYAAASLRLQEQYGDRIKILRGFEVETVPPDSYVELMQGLREDYGFQYVVGSVHFVGNQTIDYTREQFEDSVRYFGGLTALALRYYELLHDMVKSLRPEVTAHFDLIRKNAPSEGSVALPEIRDAACRALDAVAEAGSILDINTAGYRKGLGRPYPAPWILEAAREREIPVCFGDDAHRVSEVGAGIAEARLYLLQHGYDTIHILEDEDGQLVKRPVSLNQEA